jgi:DNA-binding PadR family transcriptional regulator
MAFYSKDGVKTSESTISPVQLLVLVLLSQGPAHGYMILQEFQRRLGGWTPKSGTLYPALRRLAEQEFIAGTRVAQQERPDAVQYHITPKGQRVLEEASGRLGDEVRVQDRLWRFLAPGVRRHAAAAMLDWTVRERSPIGFAVMKCQCDAACNGPTQLRFLQRYREHLRRELDWVNQRLAELQDAESDAGR